MPDLSVCISSPRRVLHRAKVMHKLLRAKVEHNLMPLLDHSPQHTCY